MEKLRRRTWEVGGGRRAFKYDIAVSWGGVKDESTPYNVPFGVAEACLVPERRASLRETRHEEGVQSRVGDL